MINDLEIVQWDYLLDPAFQLVNTAGKPLTNGWIEVYIHGTRDKYYCASDFNGTLHPFQIPLDSLGSNIVLASPANAYDVYVYNVYGSLVMSRYNVKPGSGSGSGVIPADASYGIFGTNELPFNNTSNTGFQFTAKDIGGDDITFHEITYPYGRIDCKEGVYFYSATIEVSNTTTSNESVRFQVLAGKNPNQSIYWLDFDNTYLHKQLYTVCGIANFVNDDTFRINVSPYQLTNGVKASASQVAIHKLSTVVEGEGGGGSHEYGAGWGIVINNDEIAVDPSIIPTIEYVDASVSAVSSTLISTIESVSGNLQDQIDNIPAQVQSDWNQDDDTQVDYIKNKPDLTIYATHDEVCAVSSVLQNEIDNIDMSEYVTHTELNSTVTAVSSVLENEIQIVSAAIPDVSDFVTHDEVSAVSSNLVEYVDNSVNTASGNLVQYIDDSITEVNETIENVSGNIINEVNETINNVSGDLVEYIDNSVGAVSGDIIEYVDNTVSETVNNVSGVLESEIQIVSGAIPVVTGYATKDEVNTVSSTIINTLEVVSGAIQDTIESVSGTLQEEIDNIPEQVNADWNAVSGKAEILNKPDLSVFATHDEVDNVSGTIVEYIDDSIDIVNNNVTAVSSVLNDKIDTVSGAIIHYQGASGVNVDGDTISLEDPLYIEAGEHIEFSQDGDNITISADVSDIEADIQEVSGKLDELIATVASASGIEYGQFYSTGITTTPATMARVKGTIAVDNGRIQLKKGSSYHVTVRGRYNQTTAANTNTAVGYIEYVSNNTINVNVDKTITDSQYFEISYDLYNLSNNVDYLVWFTGTDGGTVNDLWIEIHSLTGIGGQGGGTGPGTEYTPGYGIQILNNVISVSGIAPQVQSDWAQDDNSEIDFIKNKPEEIALVAGDNIEITPTASSIIISSTASGDVTHADLEAVSGALETDIMSVSGAVSGFNNPDIFYAIYGTTSYADTLAAYNAGKKIFLIDDSTIAPLSYKDAYNYFYFTYFKDVGAIAGPVIYRVSINPSNSWGRYSGSMQSNWNQSNSYAPDYIRNKPDLSVYATHTELQAVSAAMPDPQIQSDWTEDDNTRVDFIKNKPIEYDLIGGQNVSVTVSGTNVIIDSTAGGDVTETELATVSGTLHTEIQSVSSAIPEEMSLVAGDNIEIQVSGASAIISSTATGDVTQEDLATVSGTLEADIQTVSSAIPDVSNFATNAVVSSVSATLQTEIETVSASIPAELTGASGVKIEDDVASLDDPIFVKAGSGIAITQDGDDIVISSTVTATPQVNADWTAVSGAAEILNKPNEYNLIAGTNVVITKEGNDVTISARGGGGGGSSYIAGTGINIDANDVISVSGVAMASAIDVVASAIDVVSGKLPTTEEGQFTIHPNVSGADVTVIYPTDVAPVSAFYDLNAQYDDALSNRTGPSTYYYVFKSPGYVNDTWSANPGDVIQVKVKETIQGIGSIIGFYASNSTPASSNAPTINYPNNTPLIAGTGVTYVVEPGIYTIALGANPAGSSYGKYITLMINTGGSGYVDDILDKIEFTFGRPNSALGTTVNLSRYYLGNTVSTSTPSSDLACYVTVDDTTKQQKVYLPTAFPTSYYGIITQAFEYGSNRNSPSTYYYSTRQFRAYKYTSSPTRYQFAYCTDWDYANSIMTFIAYDNSGNAIEKWTLNYSSYYSNVWTTTPITPDMSEYISYSASGVYLPNSKFEIDTEGQAYKVISQSTTTQCNLNNYYNGVSLIPNQTYYAGEYEFNVPTNAKSIKFLLGQLSGTIISVTNGIANWILPNNIIAGSGNNVDSILAYSTTDATGTAINLSNTTCTLWYKQPAVKEEYITESAIPEEINLIPGSGITIEVSGVSAVISSTGGGGSNYTAGDFIDITNNVISVDDTSNVVAGNGINIAVSGTNTVISLGVTAGITDIQLVNSLPASPTSTVLYLIPET